MSEENELHTMIVGLAQRSLEILVVPAGHRGMEPPVLAAIAQVEKIFPESSERGCLIAGLWLLIGELEKAHIICQEISTVHGSAWHAVVHRMEGDFWNSKYWWRRASGLAWPNVMEEVRGAVPKPPAELKTFSSAARYDPAMFVDLVEAHHGEARMRDALVAVQRVEWMALFDECWNSAGG
jgi:hypothetical protein